MSGARREHSLLPGRQGGAVVLTEEEVLSQRCRALGQLYRAYKVSCEPPAQVDCIMHLANDPATAAQVHLIQRVQCLVVVHCELAAAGHAWCCAHRGSTGH